MNDAFRKIAQKISTIVGSPPTFLAALFVVLVWAVSGPLFAFSDTWQLVINTGTTVVTFLMVFLIQNTQNRDSRALHTKLDELIVYTQGARNDLVELEHASDDQIDRVERKVRRVAKTLGRNGDTPGEAPRAERPRRQRTTHR